MKRLRLSMTIVAAIASAAYVSSALSGSIACGDAFAPTKPMTFSGANFSAYCLPCVAALRTYGRLPVIDSVTAALADLFQSYPDTHFIYGEIGFPDGGQFRPHRTHREGTSVDIMVPMKDGKRISANPTNRFGYDEEFDNEGKGDAGEIDFGALASLIAAVEIQTKNRGGSIKRIFLAPDLQPELRSADASIFRTIQFNANQAWVRHDEHIHVDFEFSCEK